MATDNLNNGENGFESARKAFGDTAAGFTKQAGARARDYAAQGKDRAVEALDGVASLVADAATQVSEKLGDQYGGYIQQAADAVSGLATTLRDKDTDELIDDARNVVRSSPAIAIAVAAAVGFLVARVVKSGLTPKAVNDEPAATPSPAAKPRAARKPATRKAAPKKAAPKAPLADTPIADAPAPDAPAA
ncbi:hypothetical protein [Rhizorhabdus dicambivorans]|uniref:Uncharacterized protein n=1 Tax=Rhizorhabdus dicambivorans TaxID=1850238 RepID=A0A2A4FW26_9SPHN|nr:hypothetical protein [Rhizorhabdus dicambivorans]ATE65298.1 hypothetical protein CMV14_13520 [Rhizorhabdus dicambivorans]PCE42376.1 hypothetical protein COO09_10260 [Rhizorhabdus dicambivorans]